MPTETRPMLADLTALTRRLRLASASDAATDALARASARFISAVGYSPLLKADDVAPLDGNGTNVLLLPAGPVTAVTTVKLNGAAITDWSMSRRLGMLYRRAGWPWGFGNVEVTYSHGYAAADLPGDISDVVLEQAEALYRVPAGIAQSSLGPQSVSFNNLIGGGSGASQVWVETVERYRRGGTLSA